MINLSRRKLLITGIKAALASTVMPVSAKLTSTFPKDVDPDTNKSLILIHLKGGNDGYNTVIPYSNPLYRKLRPNLAIPDKNIFKLDAEFGLHPSLGNFAKLYREKKLAIIHAVGYPMHSKSHMRATEIWQTGLIDEISKKSWLNREFQIHKASNHINHYYAKNNSEFRQSINTVAKLIIEKSKNSFFHITLDGFDTHINQLETHKALLELLAINIFDLQKYLEENNKLSNSLIMIYSEFGRSLRENDDIGTDHGSSGPVFLIGANSYLNGGFMGEKENLDDLIHLKDTNYKTDFRSIYKSILEQWYKIENHIFSDTKNTLASLDLINQKNSYFI